MEEVRGAPFLGPSGKLIDGIFVREGINRAEAWVTNTVLCRPETEDELKGATPCCAPRLAGEIANAPDVPVVALGAKASGALLGKAGIMKTRGFVWTGAPVDLGSAEKASCKDEASIPKRNALAMRRLRKALEGRTILPTLHPAFILRGADGWLPLLQLDVARIARVLRGELRLEDAGPYKIPKSPAEAAKLLAKMSDVVTVDIETSGDDGTDPTAAHITCIGIADVKNPRRAVIIDPWKEGIGEGTLEREIRRYAPVIDKALRGKKVGGHNIKAFDEIALARYGIVLKDVWDTLIAHHAIASHFRQGLDHLGSVYCDVSPWKVKFRQQEEKGAVAGFSVKRSDLAVYNCSDVRIQALAWRRMQQDLAPERHVYEADMALAAVCQKMQIAGMRLDVNRQAELSKALRYRASGLIGEMRQLTRRRGFHPARLADVRKALFKDFKAPSYLVPASEKTGLPSTASGMLEKLRKADTRAGALADLLLRWRAASKVKSTFVDGVSPGRDGRVHPSWRAFGTVSGRLSCKQPNLQNLPRQSDAIEDQVRSMYIPARGHVFIYFDIQQSEMRAAALLSGDDKFLASCSSGDVHTANACILFPDARDVLLDPKDDVEKKLKKKMRDITKNAGFGILYLAEAETIWAFLHSKGFDVTLDEVVAMFDHVHATYATYYGYVQGNIATTERQGYLRTALLGRKRFLGFHPKPTDVANFMVQSFIADLMNRRVVEMDKRLPGGCRLVAQVHDACIYEARIGRPAREMAALVRETWEEPVIVEGREALVFPIDQKEGDRWGNIA